MSLDNLPHKLSQEMRERFIGGILWGRGIGYFKADWPLAELVITADEVIVRPRRFVRFLCPPGARYSIADLSFAQFGLYGLRFNSLNDQRKVAFRSRDNWQIARLLAERGVEVRDRQGNPLSPSRS